MKKISIIKYEVKGIKNLEEWVRLSFYKNTFRKDFDIKKYNVKGIYGVNGAGKSAIIRSVSIVKSLLLDPYYLSNPMVQKQLDDLINKQLKKLEIKTEYLLPETGKMTLWQYEVRITKSDSGKYQIANEQLSAKSALSHAAQAKSVFRAENGELTLFSNDQYADKVIDQTKNLLTNATLSSVWAGKKELILQGKNDSFSFWHNMYSLIVFADSISVSMESGDDHSDYYATDVLSSVHYADDTDYRLMKEKLAQIEQLNGRKSGGFISGRMRVSKLTYKYFEREVQKLYEFLRIFKDDLKSIDIDKKESDGDYMCSLVLNYGDYSVDAEFESTGIKKLIRLYNHFDRMVAGDIVFIDELDSNLHDVYLCALLEYLMDYGKGQLCFTTHNIGPMDILKNNKKSIDFLSTDHQIYSWTNNGHYSPSSLYRSGMIEGSPFNIFPFDFINSFHCEEEQE